MPEYEGITLEKYGRKLFDLAEKCEGETGIEAVKAKLAYIIAAIGQAKAKELLDGSTIDTADLIKVEAVYLGIKNEYQSVISDIENRLLSEKYEMIGNLSDSISGFASIAQVASKGNRQGFSVLK